MSSVKNKVIWITGASSGIGEALAYVLAKAGAKLILSARRKQELERVKGNCPASTQPAVRVLPLDLEQPNTLYLCTAAAVQLFGHIDMLINNAGIRHHGLVAQTPLAMDRKLMEVNYFAAVGLSKFLLPHFIGRRQGHFVNISSVTGKFGTPYRSAYAASKHALHGFFDALRAEHSKDNIRVTMVCLGFIETPRSSSTDSKGLPPREKLNEKQWKGKPLGWCAREILSVIERSKEEVYVGGREVLGVYLKRFFPQLFTRIIRRIAVR
jgi:short-subunit dehydrogenase